MERQGANTSASYSIPKVLFSLLIKSIQTGSFRFDEYMKDS